MSMVMPWEILDKRSSRRELDVHSSIILCSSDPCSTLLLYVTAVEGIVYWYSLRVNPLDGIGQTCDCPCHNVATPSSPPSCCGQIFRWRGSWTLTKYFWRAPQNIFGDVKKEFELRKGLSLIKGRCRVKVEVKSTLQVHRGFSRSGSFTGLTHWTQETDACEFLTAAISQLSFLKRPIIGLFWILGRSQGGSQWAWLCRCGVAVSTTSGEVESLITCSCNRAQHPNKCFPSLRSASPSSLPSFSPAPLSNRALLPQNLPSLPVTF